MNEASIYIEKAMSQQDSSDTTSVSTANLQVQWDYKSVSSCENFAQNYFGNPDALAGDPTTSIEDFTYDFCVQYSVFVSHEVMPYFCFYQTLNLVRELQY